MTSAADLAVSILMPVRNAEKFLPECLDSIIGQSDPNWELIAVNDNSSDRSRSILMAFAKKDDRIKVFDNDGTGIIKALRKAYAESCGDLITRMDADDLMHPDKIKVLKHNLVSHGKGHLAIGKVSYFSSSGIGRGYQQYESWLNMLTENGWNFTEIYKECSVPSPCCMVFRDDLDRSEAFDSDTYPEDYDLCFRFYQQQLQPIACHDVLHYWRDHPARSSRNDPHYADNRFLDLKLKWFLQIDRQPERPLALWGAGAKGKTICSRLQNLDIDFHWVCNNPKKIGKHIHGQLLHDIQTIGKLNRPQVLIAVANRDEQSEISRYLEQCKLVAAKNYFFLC